MQAATDAQKTEKDWSATGDNARALKVVTGILVGGVAGQGAGQIAANASAPYAAEAIGDYFSKPGHANQTAQVLSHAVLGAILAAANGSSAVGGAGAGAGGELAAQVLSRELYPKAYDPDGSFHPERLSAAETNTIIALSTGVGALVGAVASGSLGDAAVGANIAANAATNNAMNDHAKHLREEAVKKQLDACRSSADPRACITAAISAANTINKKENLAQFSEEAVQLAASKEQEQLQQEADQKKIDRTTGLSGVGNAVGDQIKSIVLLPKTVYQVGSGLKDGSIAPSALITGLATPFVDAYNDPNAYNLTTVIVTLGTLESPAGKTGSVVIKGSEEAAALRIGIKTVGSDAGAAKVVDGTTTGATIGDDSTSLAKTVRNDADAAKVVDQSKRVGAETGASGGAGAVESVSVQATLTEKTVIVDAKGNALVGDWSATKTLSAPENAAAHWTKHSAEFPEYINASEYTESALQNPPSPHQHTLSYIKCTQPIPKKLK